MHMIEVACDESGSEGEKLIGATTLLFAHATVPLPVESAAACLREMRDRIRSPAVEYKANHLQRQKHRPVLVSLLKSSRPILAGCTVYLIDKAYYVLGTLSAVLQEGNAGHGGLNLQDTLYRSGPAVFGPSRWQAFLAAANDLLRARAAGNSVDSFFAVAETLRRAAPDGPLRTAMGALAEARPLAEAYRATRTDVQTIDPLFPALVRVVQDRGPVAIVHDRQTALSDERISWLQAQLAGLRSLRLVDSRTDPRVQLADILAGVVRKIAEDELTGKGDPELTSLLWPYVDPRSIWGDPATWPLISRYTGPT